MTGTDHSNLGLLFPKCMKSLLFIIYRTGPGVPLNHRLALLELFRYNL